MKLLKKITALLAAAVMCASFSLTAFAENSDKVVDMGDLLTDSEEKQLEDRLLEIIKKYDYKYDIAVVTVDSLDGKTAEAYADDYYDYEGYGYEKGGDSGLLLLVKMTGGQGNRKIHISTYGRGVSSFTDYGIDRILDDVIPYLKDGNYYSAFDKFAGLADKYISKYETDGKPYDVSGASGSSQFGKGESLIFSVFVGLIAALIVCLIMKGQLKTAVRQVSAKNYIRRGSMKVAVARDMYLYKNVTRTKIESSSGGGGHGGSSTHRSSSGRSHGGGGRSF